MARQRFSHVELDSPADPKMHEESGRCVGPATPCQECPAVGPHGPVVVSGRSPQRTVRALSPDHHPVSAEASARLATGGEVIEALQRSRESLDCRAA
jgi:hypothetical protein